MLNPKIEPVRPRSARFVYGGADRFPKHSNVEIGKDSPGPQSYRIPSTFDKLNSRSRSPQYSTFGASDRPSHSPKDPGPGEGSQEDNISSEVISVQLL